MKRDYFEFEIGGGDDGDTVVFFELAKSTDISDFSFSHFFFFYMDFISWYSVRDNVLVLMSIHK